MEKRVCFINPPSPFLLDERVFPSLGLLMVATLVKTIGHYLVSVLDLSGVVNYGEAVEDFLRTEHPYAVGITVTTPQLPAVVAIVDIIRQKAPETRIILGGPHITLVHSAFSREQQAKNETGRASTAFDQLYKLADVLISGDGEKAILLAMGPDPPKVINADDPKSHLFSSNEDLGNLPLVDRSLIEMGSYHYMIDGVPATSLITQLGCPFGCGFCGGRNSPTFRRMRSRPIASILSEMEYLYLAFGIRGFMLFDDELNVNGLHMMELMTAVIKLQERLGVEFRLRGFIKSQLFNQEQARLMHQAGFRWVLSGFESGSPKILNNMNKKATVGQNTACVELAKRNGLKVKALMSLGHPGESAGTALTTKNWLIDIEPDDFDVTVITPYPGTPYYDEAVPHPLLHDVWVYTRNGDNLYSRNVDYGKVANFYKGNPDGGYESYVFTDHLGPEGIVALRNEVEQDVRKKLNIPYPSSAEAVRYEHSMGQSGLPGHILRQ